MRISDLEIRVRVGIIDLGAVIGRYEVADQLSQEGASLDVIDGELPSIIASIISLMKIALLHADMPSCSLPTKSER